MTDPRDLTDAELLAASVAAPRVIGEVGGQDVVVIGRDGPLVTQFAFAVRSGRQVGMQGAGRPGASAELSYRTITTSSVVSRLPARAESAE